MTSQIVRNVLSEAKKHNAKEVAEVHLVIGKLTFLGLEQVRFSYKVLIEGSIMENSKLFIETKDGIVKCSSCGYEGSFSTKDDPQYHLPIPTLQCPNCAGTVNIIGGKECLIKSVKLVVK
ncbi:MAG: hydrogenase maturation nickel metallochaperone HypA [Candidatus Bathyarchaeota archaeon]|nr:MAG: hydrogenase maturation nickel metallochaperone HypA [Candidatus Bathyarchaeota archaeon]